MVSLFHLKLSIHFSFSYRTNVSLRMDSVEIFQEVSKKCYLTRPLSEFTDTTLQRTWSRIRGLKIEFLWVWVTASFLRFKESCNESNKGMKRRVTNRVVMFEKKDRKFRKILNRGLMVRSRWRVCNRVWVDREVDVPWDWQRECVE